MNPLLIYMAKAGICLAVLFLTYQAFLSRDTMYSRNRMFILLSFILSLVLPVISIETRQPHEIQVFGRELAGITVTDGTYDPVRGNALAQLTWERILLLVYLAGALVAGLKLLTEVTALLIMIRKQKISGDRIVVINNSRTSGFSAFGYIFIDKSLDSVDALEIINHEQKHLGNLHFFDILLVEVLKVVQWFNPFIYMFDRSLRAVHEYQADEECLSSGIPVHNYQGLVMNQVFRARIFNPSNSFSNPTLIKKRMIMMTKKRSKALANLKILLVVPGLAALLIVFSTCSEKMTYSETEITAAPVPANAPVSKSGEPEPFVVVEEMPMYPGGDSALLAFILKNTTYPESAKVNNIQGRVIVRFCVTETGSVDRITVLKGVNPELDKEALRVVSTLPAFKPGKQGGKDVPVWYMVPITFALGGKLPEAVPLPPPPPPPPPPSGGSTKDTIIQYTDSKTGEKVTIVRPIVVEEKPQEKTAPFVMVEEMPKFPGGDTALIGFIARNVKYPEYAKINKITGKVIVRFCITENGDINQLSVLKGVDPSLDAEALRVVRILPAFEPGKQGGKSVPVWYNIPVTFALK